MPYRLQSINNIKEQITVPLKNLGVEEFYANFSASGHGKSEVDSAAGSANTKAKHAVITKHITINDAETFYDFCKSTIEAKPIVQGLMKKPTTLHAKRFFFIDTDEIDHTRDPENNGIKGIQSLHYFDAFDSMV